jgi:hypothetical protein
VLTVTESDDRAATSHGSTYGPTLTAIADAMRRPNRGRPRGPGSRGRPGDDHDQARGRASVLECRLTDIRESTTVSGAKPPPDALPRSDPRPGRRWRLRAAGCRPASRPA